MSKIIFMKYIPPVRRKLVPKLKMLRIIEIWHILFFKYADLNFNAKNNFYEIFTNF